MGFLKLALLVSLSSAVFSASCPANTYYSYNDGMCYFSYNSSMLWGNSVNYCNSIGGELVVPRNAFENSMFLSIVQTFNSMGTWLGAFSGDNGVWYDLKGSVLSFTRFAAGEPSIKGAACASLSPDGFWYSDYCDRGDWFICRIDPNGNAPTTPKQVPILPTTPTTTTKVPVTTTTRPVVPTTTAYKPPVNPNIRCPGYNSSVSSTPCSLGWKFYLPTCSCYSMSTKTLSWFEAEQNCVNNKAHLASVHSQEEAVYIKGLTLDSQKYIHIGLQYIGSQWLWSDGTPVDFLNWAGRGTNSDLQKNGCGFIYSEGYYFDSFMGNLPCNERHYHSVCKKPLL